MALPGSARELLRCSWVTGQMALQMTAQQHDICASRSAAGRNHSAPSSSIPAGMRAWARRGGAVTYRGPRPASEPCEGAGLVKPPAVQNIARHEGHFPPRLLPNRRVRREKQSLRLTDDHGRLHADSCMPQTTMIAVSAIAYFSSPSNNSVFGSRRVA